MQGGFGVPAELQVKIPADLSPISDKEPQLQHICISKESEFRALIYKKVTVKPCKKLTGLTREQLDAAEERRWETEFRALDSLRSEYVVWLEGAAKVFDTVSLKDCRYIVTEKCVGDLLSVGRNPCFLRSVAGQLLSALEWLHVTMKCAHNDIKPENICITKESRAVLIDFEFMSKAQDIISDCGTYGYAAPERFVKNTKSEAHQCDMWSFGYMMHVLAFGGNSWYFAADFETSGYFRKFKHDPVMQSTGDRALDMLVSHTVIIDFSKRFGASALRKMWDDLISTCGEPGASGNERECKGEGAASSDEERKKGALGKRKREACEKSSGRCVLHNSKDCRNRDENEKVVEVCAKAFVIGS